MEPALFAANDPTAAHEGVEMIFCLTLSRGTFWVGDDDPNKAMHEFRIWRAALVSLRSQMSQQQQAAARSRFLKDDEFLFSDLALLSWINYTIARTASGLLVMGFGLIELNDEIALMKGCDLPLIVRPSQTIPGQFRLIGPAYVYGIMHGEWWDEKRCYGMDLV